MSTRRGAGLGPITWGIWRVIGLAWPLLLQVFISDIRACQNKEQEQRRVEKELAKIRAKFGEDKALSGGSLRSTLLITLDFSEAAAIMALPTPFVQAMTGENTYGSSCISICWASTLTSATSRPVTLYPCRSTQINKSGIWRARYSCKRCVSIARASLRPEMVSVPDRNCTRYELQSTLISSTRLAFQNDEFLRLAINAIHLDLTSRNEAFQALALSFVGNSKYDSWLGGSCSQC